MKLSRLPLRMLAPQSSNEDVRRREFILNVFAFSVIVLLVCSLLIHTVNFLFFSDSASWSNGAISFGLLFLILSFFVGLLISSRRSYVRLASYLLISALFLLASYTGYRWGVDAHASLLFFIVVILMSGILVSARFAFLMTAASAAFVLAVGYVQIAGITQPNLYWKTTSVRITDTIMFSAIFLIIALVTWLSNREIERSLQRARRSEAALKEERDTLEVRVRERTQELRKAEVEKMTQAYRFVEFGRIASGIFHDLTNPLTALSLNIEHIASSRSDSAAFAPLAEDIDRAKRSTAHIQRLMDSMRAHLAREGTRERFSLNEAIRNLLPILEPYARSRGTTITYGASGEVLVFGDPVQCTQVMTNLISNAIESYPAKRPDSARDMVHIEIERTEDAVHVSVCDRGTGIAPDDMKNIFEPFFTTKRESQGLGIGLSLAKRIVEKEFGGTIVVESVVGKGSRFVVSCPIREP